MQHKVFEPVSGHLYALAREAYFRCLTKGEAMVQQDAVTAIILSVATLEGFINELTEYGCWHTPDWEAWGSVLHETERQHASVRLKYLLAAYLLGQPFDKGAQPYQDFQLLIELRDVLVHPKNLTEAKVVGQVLKRIIGGEAFNSRYQHIALGYGEVCSTAAGQPLEAKVRGHMKVRNRKGEPCPVCGAPIRRAGVLGHDAFFCPRCQATPQIRRPQIPWK